MHHLSLITLTRADPRQMADLMEEEAQAWQEELGWDYRQVLDILGSLMQQNLLPGYAATDGSRVVGYTYFLLHGHRGVIGTIYLSKSNPVEEAEDQILAAAIRSLVQEKQIRRIEAQIFPFNRVRLTTGFVRNGFRYFPRYYQELDLASYEGSPPEASRHPIVALEHGHLPTLSKILLRSYRESVDADICEDYVTQDGCENYLYSLLENPGCGTFLRESSFVATDFHGTPCGFILSSQISKASSMIPQISVAPEFQGLGIGNALIRSTLAALKAAGIRRVALTVTKKNRRAFNWYQELGFRVRKEFGAFVWQRQ